MTILENGLPNLAFGKRAVPFPEHGHHAFLGIDDLHTLRVAVCDHFANMADAEGFPSC